MLYYRRLPHVYKTPKPVFLTWRLHGSLPVGRHFCRGTLPSGKAFAAKDRLLDEARTGRRYLADPAVADMVVEAIFCNAEVLKHYEVHAFVVMPNHVRLLIIPSVPLPRITKSLKSITAKRANEMLGLTGESSWQEESYDHTVRNNGEFDRIVGYIEPNPVRAGFVAEACDIGGVARQGGRPGGVRGPGGPPHLVLV